MHPKRTTRSTACSNAGTPHTAYAGPATWRGGQMPRARNRDDMVRSAAKVAANFRKREVYNTKCDEVEKAFGGVGSSNDSGTSTRVFGTFLTWMQEHTEATFVFATANNVANLPPEFLRAGRFDAMFHVDLPSRQDRLDILAVVLRKFHREADLVDRAAIMGVTEGYSGAELDAVVKGGLFRAFHAGRELSTADCLAEAQQVVPISTTMKEQLDELRAWASTRAIPAGQPDGPVDAAGGVVTRQEAANPRVGAVSFQPRRALAGMGKKQVN